MNSRYAALAASALAMGAVTLMASAASADAQDPNYPYTAPPVQTTTEPWPDEGSGYPLPEPKSSAYNYPAYKLDDPVAPVVVTSRSEVPVDDGLVEALQVTGSALGGAGLALGGVWLYRRRHAPVH
ncbi:hypothetical protein [Kribbella sp. NPDC049227]|uniref:hypothetical protein n=1 Tax=Kribbella sp. NPDC049227 TaxID=3364113 RepID=UPI00371385FC